MKFEIKHAKNGAIIRVKTDEPGAKWEEYTYQERDGGEIEAFADFLRTIEENYGPATNRYSKARIHIDVQPGDKHSEVTGAADDTGA
jgi:hypothetical protein